ncbi:MULTISPECIES: CaiB/BaiF CoA transferase family protein [Caballeronia]|uniref:CaiB/BaiF CoA transferase family protein n=1 Tax=Caballeronia TaxID=1827195 RepID=UPI00023884E1|nr:MULTISPECIES: CaiB/BaiF CoA-transferase family protein [unclassified Caballeronia]AET88880.1 L-carnitine dehydratase/bile acid-inducible protein F [Burkholderia sp. YI23]MCE4542081.1 CoA transferase [Caballeronia sp. PC1]MCE4568873.1 CoA transferase [Caballeronia sp. CLC5]BAO86130.1 L-carnitine dehydratase/bile acid-inducible protein F [Burkholderia sp. RPE67]
MTPSLTGLRVLDLTRLLPGPIATLRLAELGADVLKIEPPGEGDYARAMLQSDADRQSGTPSAFYRIVNRGKRQLTLDLKTDEGRAKLIELARDADVLIESFRPSVMARLGVGYDVLREANPKLVYCAITGFGAEGPFAQKAGHDLNYLAYAGVLDQLAARDGTPVAPNFQLADLLGGALAAVMEILAAAWQVAHGGEGRCLNVSMTHAIHTHNVMAHIALANENEASTRAGAGLLNGGAPCYDVYRTRDDRFIAVGALELKFWQTLCNALGRPDWAAQHWSLGQAIGGADAARLSAELAACFRERTRDEWMALLEPLDCCVAPVLTPAEAAAHPLFER